MTCRSGWLFCVARWRRRGICRRERGLPLLGFRRGKGGEARAVVAFSDAGWAGEDQAVRETVFGVGLAEPSDGGGLAEDVGEGKHQRLLISIQISA